MEYFFFLLLHFLILHLNYMDVCGLTLFFIIHPKNIRILTQFSCHSGDIYTMANICQLCNYTKHTDINQKDFYWHDVIQCILIKLSITTDHNRCLSMQAKLYFPFMFKCYFKINNFHQLTPICCSPFLQLPGPCFLFVVVSAETLEIM